MSPQESLEIARRSAEHTAVVDMRLNLRSVLPVPYAEKAGHEADLSADVSTLHGLGAAAILTPDNFSASSEGFVLDYEEASLVARALNGFADTNDDLTQTQRFDLAGAQLVTRALIWRAADGDLSRSKFAVTTRSGRTEDDLAAFKRTLRQDAIHEFGIDPYELTFNAKQFKLVRAAMRQLRREVAGRDAETTRTLIDEFLLKHRIRNGHVVTDKSSDEKPAPENSPTRTMTFAEMKQRDLAWLQRKREQRERDVASAPERERRKWEFIEKVHAKKQLFKTGQYSENKQPPAYVLPDHIVEWADAQNAGSGAREKAEKLHKKVEMLMGDTVVSNPEADVDTTQHSRVK